MNISLPILFWKYLAGARWWLGIFLALLGFGVCGGWYITWSKGELVDRDLPGKTIRTEGVIQSRERKNDWVGPPDDLQFKSVYLLRYKYQDPEGQPFTGTAAVSQVAFNSVTEGDPVQVEFSAERPDLNRLVGLERPPMGWPGFALIMVFSVIGLLGLWLMATALLRAQRRSRMIMGGRPCLGRVNEVVGPAERDAVPHHRSKYYLGYSFTDHKGIVREGRTQTLTPNVVGHWQPGDPILVLYHPENIHRHEVDLYGVRGDDLARLLNLSENKVQ
jgi:hypothetical protein